jgi:hypothetical protein
VPPLAIATAWLVEVDVLPAELDVEEPVPPLPDEDGLLEPQAARTIAATQSAAPTLAAPENLRFLSIKAF